eukprot:UN17688
MPSFSSLSVVWKGQKKDYHPLRKTQFMLCFSLNKYLQIFKRM